MNPNILGISRVDTADFIPMAIDGEDHGEVHFVRDDQLHGRINRVAVWQLRDAQLPYESAYVFRADETILIVEGELAMTFEDGTAQYLRQGDIVSIAAGTKSHWRIVKPFKKLVVETGI